MTYIRKTILCKLHLVSFQKFYFFLGDVEERALFLLAVESYSPQRYKNNRPIQYAQQWRDKNTDNPILEQKTHLRNTLSK